MSTSSTESNEILLTTHTDLPVVAVVGRPNVGKSTLVNRILGRRAAIVEERPGVTRDRREYPAEWRGQHFVVVDTGGWLATDDPLAAKVTVQAEKAMRAADLLLVVVDVTTGITDEDERVAAVIRRLGVPHLLCANKVDNDARINESWELMGLGLGDPITISALHGRKTGDLLDRILDELGLDTKHAATARDDDFDSDQNVDELWEILDRPEPEKRGRGAGDMTASVALIGRPNVGKSTLFNRLVNDERAVVHDMPGTTRDTVDTVIESEAGPLRLLDTAGLRRKSRVDDSTEYYSLVRTLQAIDTADVAVLVIDATSGVTHQDQRLAERIDAAGTAIVVLMNKWELLDAEGRASVTEQVTDKLAFIGYAPVLKGSALTGKGIHKLLPAVDHALEAYRVRIPTRALNKVIQAAQHSHPAPGARVLYATQGATDPPTFTLFASKALPQTYLRYLERMIREAFDMGPTPMKLRVRRRTG